MIGCKRRHNYREEWYLGFRNYAIWDPIYWTKVRPDGTPKAILVGWTKFHKRGYGETEELEEFTYIFESPLVQEQGTHLDTWLEDQLWNWYDFLQEEANTEFCRRRKQEQEEEITDLIG